jgi:hypothetical protein
MKPYSAVKLTGKDTPSSMQTRMQHGEIIGIMKEKYDEKMDRILYFSTQCTMQKSWAKNLNTRRQNHSTQ